MSLARLGFAARLKRAQEHQQQRATRAHPPRLVVLYEDDPVPLDWRESDRIIRVVYAPALPVALPCKSRHQFV